MLIKQIGFVNCVTYNVVVQNNMIHMLIVIHTKKDIFPSGKPKNLKKTYIGFFAKAVTLNAI